QETVPVVLRAIEPLIPPLPSDVEPDAGGQGAAPRLNPPREQIAEFCSKWKVDELALFGSVLRDDFRPDSDVDVLLTFAPDAGVSLFDYAEIQDDLEAIFGRRVDVASKRGIQEGRNPFSQKAILGSARVIYPAA
ncbi:MAG TPA: nucleotidyltransferase family protein, partial [Longimicrobium sp.]|nr:nucleotidyltransferase family protein [Longimicrobium sp.]